MSRSEIEVDTQVFENYRRELRQRLHEACDVIEDEIVRCGQRMATGEFRTVVTMIRETLPGKVSMIAKTCHVSEAHLTADNALSTPTGKDPYGEVGFYLARALLAALRQEIGVRPVARASNDSSRQRVVDEASAAVPPGVELPEGIAYDAPLETLPGWNGLSFCLRNWLRRYNYESLSSVLEADYDEMLRVSSFGYMIRNELIRWLDCVGIRGGALLDHPHVSAKIVRIRAAIKGHATRQRKAHTSEILKARSRGGTGR